MDRIDAVIFDMDGLMFDTEKLWLDSVIKTNEVYGYKVPTEVVIDCMGMRKDFINKRFKEVMGQDFDTDEFRRLNKIFAVNDVEKNGLKIKKGLIELLEFLKSKNIKVALASSSKMDKIKQRFKEANLSMDYFEYIIGGDMVTNPKPDPSIYIKSCEVLGVEPENAIALEDSEYGILSAYRAGMKPILIPDIKCPDQDTINISYKKYDNLLQVIDLFKKD